MPSAVGRVPPSPDSIRFKPVLDRQSPSRTDANKKFFSAYYLRDPSSSPSNSLLFLHTPPCIPNLGSPLSRNGEQVNRCLPGLRVLNPTSPRVVTTTTTTTRRPTPSGRLSAAPQSFPIRGYLPLISPSNRILPIPSISSPAHSVPSAPPSTPPESNSQIS